MAGKGYSGVCGVKQENTLATCKAGIVGFLQLLQILKNIQETCKAGRLSETLKILLSHTNLCRPVAKYD